MTGGLQLQPPATLPSGVTPAYTFSAECRPARRPPANLRGVTGEQDRLPGRAHAAVPWSLQPPAWGVGNRNHADRLQRRWCSGVHQVPHRGQPPRSSDPPGEPDPAEPTGPHSAAHLPPAGTRGTHNNQSGGAILGAFLGTVTRAAQHAAHASGNTLKAAHTGAEAPSASTPCSRAKPAIARAIGCSLSASTAAASRRTDRERSFLEPAESGEIPARSPADSVTKGAVERHGHLAGRHGTGLIQHHAINRARRLQHLEHYESKCPTASRDPYPPAEPSESPSPGRTGTPPPAPTPPR